MTTPAMSTATSGERASTSIKRNVAGFGVIALIMGSVAICLRSANGYPLRSPDPNVVAAAAFVGALAAMGLLYKWIRRVRSHAAPLTASSIGTILAGIGLVGYKLPMVIARAGTQMVAFAGLASASHALPLTVVGSHYEWWAKRGGNVIDVRSPIDGHTISLPASDDAYNDVRPGDTIELAAQTGRFGFQRIVLAGPVARSDLRRP